jgi:hypothetical protein
VGAFLVEGLKERLVWLKTRFFQILGHVIFRCKHQNIVEASSAIEAPDSNLSPRASEYYLLLGLAAEDGVAAGTGVMLKVSSWS